MARFEDKFGEQNLVTSLVDLLNWRSGSSAWASRGCGDCAAQQPGREVLTRKRHIVFLSCARDVLLTWARDQADWAVELRGVGKKTERWDRLTKRNQ